MTCKNLIIVLTVLAGGFSSYGELTGNWVTLTNSTKNAIGVTNGWNASYWDDGRAPHPDADYLVTDGLTCHTPRWGSWDNARTPTNFVFGGNSLVVSNAVLALTSVNERYSPDAPVRITFPNDGFISPESGGKWTTLSNYEKGWVNLFGKLTIHNQYTGMAFRFTSTDWGGTKEKTTVVWGDLIGDSTSVAGVAGKSPRYTLRLEGNCSRYFGKIIVALTNDLDLGSITLPGHVEVRDESRVQMASSAYAAASVGSLTMKDKAILGVSVDGATPDNGTITVLDSFSQENGFVVCLTNYLDETATVRIPPKAVLKLASTAAGTINPSKITIDPETDMAGNRLVPVVENAPDGSASLFVSTSCTIGGDEVQAIGLDTEVDQAGKVSVSASGSNAQLTIRYNSFSNLLAAASLRLDANMSGTITQIDKTDQIGVGKYDKEGRPYVDRWKNVNSDSNKYMKQWNNTATSSTTGLPHRRTGAYPTVQEQIVNGVERSYMDFGQLDGSPNLDVTNMNGTNTTAAALEAIGGALQGLEFHIVHSDAHRNENLRVNDTGVEWRPPLLGRTNTQTKPNRTPGRRGVNGELFIKWTNSVTREVSTDAFTADGCVYVDNCATNYTYIPEWGDVHVYTLIPTNAFYGATAFTLFNTLGCDTYARYGGQRTGEILVYDSATNTVADRTRIDDYLMKKWMNVGEGPRFDMFNSVVLANGADITLTTDIGQEEDVGCETAIGTLSGNGTLRVAGKDSVYLGGLSVAFSGKDVCDSLAVHGGKTVLAPEGTLLVSKPAGIRRVAAGTHVLLSAAEESDLTAFENWTIDVSSLGVEGVRVYRDGTSILMDVPQSGFMFLLR